MNILSKNLMILASAGSGKTYQLANRVIGLVGRHDVDPRRIVALTFTRKAAGEFADSILTKLAEGTLSERVAEEIERDLGGALEVSEVLQKVVLALPQLQLTTLDGFFSTVVQGFQNELGLTGGAFELLEGEQKKVAEGKILDEVLMGEIGDWEQFYHAFRKAALGRGQQGVRALLEEFVQKWRAVYRSGVTLAMFRGEAFGTLPEPQKWEQEKRGLLAKLREGVEGAKLSKVIDRLEVHSLGKSLSLNAIGERLLGQLSEPTAVELQDGRKTILIEGVRWQLWRKTFQTLIDSELAAAVAKTAAVGELVARIDAEYERHLRRRGQLSFDDVKLLLGRGMQDEQERIKREQIDYRLDGKYDHWLLDEFQDTSLEQWKALESLVDEVVGGEDGGLFVVGDRKQGIYGWRGGDVTLFDHLQKRYDRSENQFQVEPMDRSWRSSPEVLSLVNCVFGNIGELGRLFGPELAERWVWEDHLAAKPERRGQAEVIETSKEAMAAEVVAKLRELKIGEKQLTCGLLVRTGAQEKEYAEMLRAEGFDVIESGTRNPGTDHAAGVTLVNLVEWLSNPADHFARRVVEMSPVRELLEEVFGEEELDQWSGLLRRAQEQGYGRALSSLFEPLRTETSAYGLRRLDDLLSSLEEFDQTGVACPREAATWITQLEVPQAPGTAAIQVMTIHKSKGLGFDVVLIPALSDQQVPNKSYFEIAQGADWFLQVTPGQVLEQIPEIQKAKERWAIDQIYEAICLFYVALTRAKRGLYVFLPESPVSRKEDKRLDWRSPANLLRQTAGEDFIEGDLDWLEEIPEKKEQVESEPIQLGKPVTLPAKVRPSDCERVNDAYAMGLSVGAEVHGALEKVTWLENGEEVDLSFTLKKGLRKVFEKVEGAELYREQEFSAMVEGELITGTVDRMHVLADRVEVYDFKTDTVSSREELRVLHQKQMEKYRMAIEKIYGRPVFCFLVSISLGEVIACDD